jgi:predicted RNase H-like HicB family nuclease
MSINEVGDRMTYDVLLTKGPDNRYTARALLLPDLVASGADEAEALERLRAVIAEVQANSRYVLDTDHISLLQRGEANLST